ncbi:MAG: hypothetical protein IH840_12995 [Candidatus Heimdallarchaeota archaeon]|nr:hypothetical protein [Candidatus Heimdallarchaeota archaeon]
MKFPCELIAEPYIAHLRVTVAKTLKQDGLTQQQIAKLLGVSQPVVSGYLRKNKIFTGPKEISIQAENVGKQISSILVKSGENGTTDAIEMGCRTCKKLRQGGPVCVFHKEVVKGLKEDCTSCWTKDDLILLQTDKESLLSELRKFFSKFSEKTKFQVLIPEIGLQIAYGTQNMLDAQDIASFPNRIIKRKKGKPIAEIPMFGSSETMSKILLQSRSVNQDVRLVIGVKTSDWLIQRLIEHQVTMVTTNDFEQNYTNIISHQMKGDLPLAIVNVDEIGYESICYIFFAESETLENLTVKLISY